MAFTIFFLSMAVNILSSILPTSASPLAASSANQSSSSPVHVAVTRPPKPPICPQDLGPIPPRTTFFARDCENAVAMIPRDIRPSSPLRNFYLLAEHVDPAMPNVQLPFERESGMSNTTFLSCIFAGPEPPEEGKEQVHIRRDVQLVPSLLALVRGERRMHISLARILQDRSARGGSFPYSRIL